MTDCDKYKKKALVGSIIIILTLIGGRIFKENLIETIGMFFTIIISACLIIYGGFLLQKYWKCILDYNNRHNTP